MKTIAVLLMIMGAILIIYGIRNLHKKQENDKYLGPHNFEPNKFDTVRYTVKAPEFHIRVSPFLDNPEHWMIEFTNNGWLTSDRIVKAEDMNKKSEPWLQPIMNKEDAISFAKSLNSYEECIRHNERENFRLSIMMEEFESIPVVEKPKLPKREPILIK